MDALTVLQVRMDNDTFAWLDPNELTNCTLHEEHGADLENQLMVFDSKLRCNAGKRRLLQCI